MVRLAAVFAGTLLLGPVVSAQPLIIKSDEQVVFFPTTGYPVEDGKTWVLPIHGWIYEPSADSFRRAAAVDTLKRSLGLEPEAPTTRTFEQRARMFLVDNERGKRIRIRLLDSDYTLGASEPNGHFEGEIRLPTERLGEPRRGRIEYQAITISGDHRVFKGWVQLPPHGALMVVSDIDDTIKITEVTNRRKLLENTFYNDFRAVPGMAELYRRWAEQGAVFHYVSSSPWQLYGPLADLLRAERFPSGAVHLKVFRMKDASFLSLFASPEVTKPLIIEPIFKRFPNNPFVLVGDSGEKDPEVYGALARLFPQQIQGIYIRDVTNEPAESPRYTAAFADVPPERWQVFTDPARLPIPQRSDTRK